MPIRIQLRRDTAANWASVNPVLAQGEMGIEIDTDRAKIGNAVDAWNDLPYVFESGGVAASAGTEAITNGTLVFSNSNGISFGLNNSTLTASYTVPSQTQFILSNSNNVSFGTNGSTVTASASFSQSIQTQGSVLVNGSSGSIVFSNSNGFTFGNNNSTITASYTVPTVTNSSWSVSGGTSSETVSQLVFSNANGVSFGLDAGTITASHNGLTSQSNQAISGSNGSFTFQTASFGNSNGLSFYTTNGSLVGSYTVPAQTAQTGISSVALSDATYTSGQISFRDGNGISWASTTGQGISITHALQFTSNTSAITSNAVNTADARIRAIAASDATYTSGSVTFRDLNGITWQSTTGQQIQITHGLQYTSNTSAITSAALHTSASRVINIVAATNSTGGGTASLSSNVSFSNANNFTFYTSAGNAIVASYSQSADTNKAGTGFTSAGNNIGLSGTLNTNGLSLSATAAAQTNQTLGVYGSSQTTGSASSGTHDARSLSIIGAGIISVGNHSTSADGTTTGVIISATQSNQAISGSNGSFAFQTVTFGSSNGMHFYTTNGSLVGSYTVPTQTNQTIGLYGSSQTTGQSSSSTYDARSLTIRGAGIISVGNSGGEFIISATGGGGGLTNINLSAGTTSNNLSAFTLGNANGISFGLDGSTVTASHNGITSQTNQTLGGYFVGNTTGQSSSSTWDARTLSFDGAGIVSAGWSAGSIRISATQSNQAVSANNGSYAFQTLSFSNVNGISFGTSAGSAITASHNALTTARASNDAIGLNTAQTNVTWTVNSSGLSLNAAGYAGTGTTFNGANISGSITQNSNGLQLSMSVAAPGAAAENNWHHLLGANTAGNTTASGSTIGLSGINLTLSGTNGSAINISAPATSSLSATGQVSISTNGSTISIGVPNAYTNSGLNVYADTPYVFSTNQASLMIDPNELPNVQFDRVGFLLNNTNSSNSSGSHTLSFWFGLYTRTGSTLSLLTSVSSSTNITHSGTAGSYSLYSGARLFTIGLTNTLTEGKYWFGFLSRTTSGGANGSYSVAMISQLNSNFLGHFGSSHNTTYQYNLGKGVYATTTSGLPNSIAFNQIRGSDLAVLRPAVIQLISSTV